MSTTAKGLYEKPTTQAERIVASIATAGLAVIPKAGHSSAVEQPAAVTTAIETFLGGIGSPA